jgi:hypothetical protein
MFIGNYGKGIPIIHHVVGLYRWSKTCYFEFFVVLFNPFWYCCTLFPCYSTVVPYYCPLSPCYSTVSPYYLPFSSCYSTLLACHSIVRSSYSTLILFISLSSRYCGQLQTQNYSRLDLKCSVVDLQSVVLNLCNFEGSLTSHIT